MSKILGIPINNYIEKPEPLLLPGRKLLFSRRGIRVIRFFAAGLVRLYQKVASPLLVHSCRFYPSCSEYAKQALLKYGLIKGGFLALKRVLVCHPFSGKCGLDPLK